MAKENERDKQTIRFLKWIEDYPGWWHIICTPDCENINVQTIQDILKKLAKESMYEIMLVFLMVHRKDNYMKNLTEAMFIQMLIAQWEDGHKEDIVEELIHHFDWREQEELNYVF